MKRHRSSLPLFAVALLGLCALSSCDISEVTGKKKNAETEKPAPAPKSTPAGPAAPPSLAIEEITGEPKPTEESNYWEKARELYEKAKESGEQVPDDIIEWVKEDIRRIGSWEYKILTLQIEDTEKLEMELNHLGRQRWECYWIDDRGVEKRFYFKKQRRSYLKALSTADIMKLIPKGESE